MEDSRAGKPRQPPVVKLLLIKSKLGDSLKQAVNDVLQVTCLPSVSASACATDLGLTGFDVIPVPTTGADRYAPGRGRQRVCAGPPTAAETIPGARSVDGKHVVIHA